MAHGYRGFWRMNRRKNNAAKSAHQRRKAEVRTLGHEGLEGRQMLAVTVDYDPIFQDLLFYDDNTGTTSNTVSLFMQDAIGSSLYYSINGGDLLPLPSPLPGGTGPQTGVLSIRFLDSTSDGAGGGDTLALYGFGGATIDVSGKNLLFGGTTPITTLNVENFLIDGLESRSPVNLDGVSVENDLTVRNASVTTVATTTRLEVGGNLSVDTNTLQLPGAMSAGGTVSLVLSGGVLQAANAPITASSLTVVNSVSGDVLLTNSDNAVDSLSIRNLADSGAVSFTDADGLTIGVGGFGIVANDDAVTISSGGRLQLNENIEAGDGTVYLIAANGIGQAGDKGVIARSLTFRNGSAAVNPSLDVTLLGSLNGVDILAGVNYSFDGDIAFANSKGLSIGAGVDGISGLTNFAGVIRMTSGGQLSIDDAVLANNSGAIFLEAANGVQQSGAGRLVGRDVSVTNNSLGGVALALADNNAEFLSINNQAADGTITYADVDGFTVGSAGITASSTSGGVVLTSKGTIDQVGAITTRTLAVNNLDAATGNIALGLTTNDVSFLTISNANATGTVSYGDASGFAVSDAGIDAAGNAVSLAANGAVTQSGDILVDSLAITQTGAGGVAFTRTTNSIPTLTGSIGTGALAVTTQTPLVVGAAGIAAGQADVRLTAEGSITQVGTVAAQSLHAENTSAATGDILLVSPLNAIASFTAVNPNADGTVDMVTEGSTAIGAAGVNAAGDINITVAGSLNDTGTINLVGSINTTAGDVTITAAQGSLAFSPTDRQISVPAGNLTLQSLVGQILSTPTLKASDALLLTGELGVTSVTSLDGLSVTIIAECGPVKVADICAVEDVTIEGRDQIALTGTVQSQTGMIGITSTTSDVDLQGVLRTGTGDIKIETKQSVNFAATLLSGGSIDISVGLGIVSQGGGIASIEVLAGGSNYEYAIVTVSPPASGRGQAALARAVISNGVITAIEILDPGYGYVPGERVQVQIEGNPGRTITVERVLPDGTIQVIELEIPPGTGAFAIATASDAVTAMSAKGDVTVTAVSNISLPMLIEGGNVRLSSGSGTLVVTQVSAALDVILSGELGVTADGNIDGQNISLVAECGPVSASDVCAVESLSIEARDEIRLSGTIESKTADVKATSSAGGIFLNANVVSQRDISLDAETFVQQAAGTGIERIVIVSAGLADATFPTVVVTVAPPSAGGIAATARAVVGLRSLGRDAQTGQQTIEYYLDSIVITNPGQGYALGENPIVTIEGGFNGAIAQAVGPTNLHNLTAGNGIIVTAIDDVRFVNALTARAGDVDVSTINGHLDLSASTAIVTAVMGSASLTSSCGSVTVQAVCADQNVTLRGDTGVQVLASVDAGQAISVSAGVGNVTLAGEMLAETGSIEVSSASGGIALAVNMNAGDAIDVKAHGGVSQTAGSGLRRIDLLSGGESEDSDIPTVIVSIAAPANGGLPATAFARLESFSNAVGATRYRVQSIEIINPGSGYRIGETPSVQITGINGAAALAIGPTGYQNLVAENDLRIAAGDNVTLVNTIRSTAGTITVSSVDGDVDISGSESLLHAPGASIDVRASAGHVQVYSAEALDSVAIDGEVGVEVLTNIVAGSIEVASGTGNINLKGMITAQTGSIDIQSRSASVAVAANLFAMADDVDISAAGGVNQTVASGLREIEVLFGGESESTTVPTVEVAVARPAAGGVAAKAFARLRGFTDPLGQTRYTIDSIVITDPGRGYVIGERPQVTIEGVVGAAALAYGPIGFQNIIANKTVSIQAGSDVILTNTVQAETGDISVTSLTGNLDMGNDDMFVNAVIGSVNATSTTGFVAAERINAGAGVTIQAESRVSLEKEILSGTSDINVTSRSGTLFLTANIQSAAAGVRLTAAQGVLQTAETGITEIRILVPGTFIGNAAPDVVVTIDPPAGGGTTATAEALLEITGYTRGNNPVAIWGISEIIITNPGSGYAIGENPQVTFSGGITGAVALAYGPTGSTDIAAVEDVVIVAGGDSRLVSSVRSSGGNVAISTSGGDLDLTNVKFIAQSDKGDVSVQAARGAIEIRRVAAFGNASIHGQQGVTLFDEVKSQAGTVAISAAAGEAVLRNVLAEQDVSVDAEGSIHLLGAINSVGGNVSLTSVNRDLDFTAADALVFADAGGVTLTSLNGSILSPPVLNVGGDVKISSFNTVRLNNEVTSQSGAIDVRSTSGGIALGANLVANDGSISLTAKSGVTQLGRGIASAKVLTGGRGYDAATRVTLDAPTAGGVSATARPVIGRVNGVSGVIVGIQIVNPGSGYGVGEEVNVTITGTGSGANAVAFASSVLQNVSAANDVSINAGAGIMLLNTVSTLDGDIALRANVGDIDLSTETVKLSAKNGSVEISTFTGKIISPPTLHVSKNIFLQSSAALTLANELTADEGDITLKSTSGGVSLANNVFAGNRVTIEAHAGILQASGFVQSQELVVANKSALPIILGAQENNVDRFAGSSIGGITYVDADSFETGVLRGGKLGDQVREVMTNGALTLQAGTSSSGPLRIVGGVSAAPNQLFLSSGSAANPGFVEYVVTNDFSASASTFSGSLANMIALSNANRARFDGQVVPQAIVFDADGYAVETIAVSSALPFITQPVLIDGSATESSVALERVEITRGLNGPVNGLVFAAGSAGSAVTGLSVTNFSTGAAITLLSAGSTVTDNLVGVARDGLFVSPNLVGVDVLGTAATGNTIGGTPSEQAAPEDGTANVIGGNTIGIRVRGGATGNTIAGNFVGTDGFGETLGNVVGIQLVGALATTVSDNLISNNTDGIQVNQTRATQATANQIRSNAIVGNATGAGIRVTASSFAVIGGENLANTIGQNKVGVVIEKASTSNTVAANYIGTDVDGRSLGNTTDGIQVTESIGNTIGGSTSVDANVIANNRGVGILLQNSLATTVAAGNRVLSNTVQDNVSHGIRVTGGGRATIANNTVMRNRGNGIDVGTFALNGRSFGSVGNVLRSNLVGTDSADDMVDQGNRGVGISIAGGSGNVLEAGNVVRFNAKGVVLNNTSGNMIGSRLATQGNVISDNDRVGVEVTGGSKDNTISGNAIERNNSHGIVVSGSTTTGTVIGDRSISGRIVSIGNVIADNAGFGVFRQNGARNVQVIGNSMVGNSSGGLNALAGFSSPVLTSAVVRHNSGAGSQLVVNGTVRGTPRQQVLVDVYSTPKNELNGQPGGKRFLGRVSVLIGADGVGLIKDVLVPLNGTVAGDAITATVTTLTAATAGGMVATPIGSTSAFSAAVTAVLPAPTTPTTPTTTRTARGTPTSRV